MIAKATRRTRIAGLAIVGILIVLAVLAWRVSTRPTNDLASFAMPACSAIGTGSGRVFHVDRVNGRPDGDGSGARPWNDLQALVDAGLLGEHRRSVWLVDRLFGAITHRPVPVRLKARSGALVKGGDTILLADGDYGAIDLSRIVNHDFLTIAAAPGARPRFSTLEAGGASHFVLRGISISGPQPLPERHFLASTHSYGSARADNLVFENIGVSWTTPIGTGSPAAWAEAAPHGMLLGGDCLTVRDSDLHDLETAIAVFRGRQVTLEGNTIRDFSIDGIDYAGRDIVIRGNRIFDQWATPDRLHPDCMQAHAPDDQTFGPVLIEGNVCIRQTSARQRPPAWQGRGRFGWMGINIFNGHWSGVTARCNLVIPSAQHGMAFYGVSQALVEHNTVVGDPNGKLSWIAMMPSMEGRPPRNVVVRGNRSTGYLNAIHGAALPPQEMIAQLKVIGKDQALMDALAAPIPGVVLEGNTWLVKDDMPATIRGDRRFRWDPIAPIDPPRDVADAIARYPLPPACGA